jgi:hypothetical protein
MEARAGEALHHRAGDVLRGGLEQVPGSASVHPPRRAQARLDFYDHQSDLYIPAEKKS